VVAATVAAAEAALALAAEAALALAAEAAEAAAAEAAEVAAALALAWEQLAWDLAWDSPAELAAQLAMEAAARRGELAAGARPASLAPDTCRGLFFCSCDKKQRRATRLALD
jgi:hypothetical protein